MFVVLDSNDEQGDGGQLGPNMGLEKNNEEVRLQIDLSCIFTGNGVLWLLYEKKSEKKDG